jgi:hypothetical protein
MKDKFKVRQVALAASVLSAAAILLACGGGSSSPTYPTLQGLAASGAAIPNAPVVAKCATGPQISGTTGTDGSFTLTLSGGQTTPCIIEVTIGTGSTATTLHSFATAAGRVNVTPLSELVVANALHGDPSVAFATYTAASGTTIQSGLAAAKTYVQTQVVALGVTPTVDPLTGVFVVGSQEDNILDGIKNALTDSSKTLGNLVTAAANTANLNTVITVPVTTTTSTTTTTTATTAAPTTTTTTATTAAPTTTTTTATTAAPTTTTTTATTAAPTTTTTVTTVATTTTTTTPVSVACQVQVGSAIGYVTGVSSSAICTNTNLNVDGGGASVSVAPSTLLAGKTTLAYSALISCDPFGAPPAAGATTLTACKLP